MECAAITNMNLVFAKHECCIRHMGRDARNIRDVTRLREAFGLVGSLLEAEGTDVAIAVVGGPALLLNGRLVRVTRDVDVTAFIDDGVVSDGSPDAEALIRRVSAVALVAARAWCRTQDVSGAFAKEVDAAVV